MIGHASLQRWRHPKRLVATNEIVVEEVQGYRMLQVLDFLREGIRQSGKPPHAHPHGQVLPFHEVVEISAGSGLPETAWRSQPMHSGGLYFVSASLLGLPAPYCLMSMA
jgi:hypothetical protein